MDEERVTRRNRLRAEKELTVKDVDGLRIWNIPENVKIEMIEEFLKYPLLIESNCSGSGEQSIANTNFMSVIVDDYGVSPICYMDIIMKQCRNMGQCILKSFHGA